ncbi:MAG: toprim domain-containing protein, partial [Clostridiales bacterium]|nr:toprim domain-containing protein [Clostridiales bacterium]
DRYFDMFRQRAMFPIIDTFGKVVGFGGRAMGDHQPKYLNTADTLVFNKRYGVYGGNFLKRARNLSQMILVEGYMDVLALSQQGIEGVVATLGTALTIEQANLLKRFSSQLWIAYDGDSAGQQATLRALGILEEAGLTAKVLIFPEGLDPDDYINQYGVKAFQALSPVSAITFKLMLLQKNFDLSKEDARIEYAKASAQLLSAVTSPVELESHLTFLSLATGFSKEILLAQIGAQLPKEAQKFYRPKKNATRKGEKNISPTQKAEQLLLAIYSKNLLPTDFISSKDFSTPLTKEIYRALESGTSVPALLEQYDSDSDKQFLLALFALDTPNEPDVLLQMAEGCLKTIKQENIKQQLSQLTQELAGASNQDKASIMTEIQALNKALSS